MCGIAGIHAYHYAAPAINREELRRIRDHMASRGPDGEGEWFSEDGRVALGHRRLAIIDLSERGAQPMQSADGRFVISFNGEIYNYKALRAELEREGHVFSSHSDTEVLLKLYASRGEAMFSQLRGMYAFGIWDAEKRELLLARDPYGIKPLYYADDGWTARFASQVKALRAGGKVSDNREPAGEVGFFLLGSVPEPYTCWQEIRAVPAGGIVRIGQLGPEAPRTHTSIAQVWTAAAQEHQTLSEDALQSAVSEALRDSVAHHLVADVPVGAFLSAGIDSGALTGLATEELSRRLWTVDRRPLQTITLAFEEFHDTPNDEAPLAKAVAKHYGAHYGVHYVARSEFEKELPVFLDAMDQPTIDGLNTWFVSKATSEAGLKVAISGLGGDELFGGYPSFRDVPRWVKLFRVPGSIPGLGHILRSTLSALRTPVPSINPKVPGLMQFAGTYPGAYLVRRGLFMPWELTEFLDRDLIREGLRRLRPLANVATAMDPDPREAFPRVAALEAGNYMRNQLLRDTDWTAMAHSLEVRTPLVDIRLLESLAPLLVGAKTRQGKSLLGASPARPLPTEVVSRQKTGFGVPVADWLHDSKDIDVWKRVRSLRQDSCHWSRRWAYTIGQLQLAA
jgi:asparagine synthase (glutamine-hydrolysing)